MASERSEFERLRAEQLAAQEAERNAASREYAKRYAEAINRAVPGASVDWQKVVGPDAVKRIEEPPYTEN